jgi:hypothetical protein
MITARHDLAPELAYLDHPVLNIGIISIAFPHFGCNVSFQRRPCFYETPLVWVIHVNHNLDILLNLDRHRSFLNIYAILCFVFKNPIISVIISAADWFMKQFFQGYAVRPILNMQNEIDILFKTLRNDTRA